MLKYFFNTCAIIAVVISSQLSAEEGQWKVGVILGSADLVIDSQHSVTGGKESIDSFTLGLELEYRWPEKYIIDTRMSTTTDSDILGIGDNYDLFQWNTMLGYSFEINEFIHFVPKIGLSHWDLDTRESPLFNPGPEAEFSFSGTDLTYQIGFDFVVNENITIELAYENTSYTFGDIDITNFGISFEF